MPQNQNNPQGNEQLVEWTEPKEKFTPCDWAAGIYEAQVKEIQEAQGKYGEMKRVIFNVIRGTAPTDLVELAWTAYPRVNRETKMGKALISLGVKEGTSFKWNDLVGKKCKVYIKPATYKNKKGETVTSSQIQDVNPWT